MDNYFGCLNSSLYFLFCNEPAKKIMAYLRLQLNLPTLYPIRACTLLAGSPPLPPSPFRAYLFCGGPFMGDFNADVFDSSVTLFCTLLS